ncbi:response regulator [Methylobacterium gnaphalii]|uniref:DNA-binding response regulator n=1 Tax=Methylobacterium gnaphalii TaxID=1010610 RepID=A0A512JJU6_9HYPH|nr:response regulator transcription factor [Methylobacterium gnaphalii]GEP10200.1 DNA-binding response regulator [Methylobacterium gnaphalii]GJD68558.1 Transcriptional regulatory protein DegU [Methylobacterium gnaphalii]GLS48717.1 DNA-binding response regulator [Methylobacterium gnaphalii]
MLERALIRTVLADDHPVFRHGVADLLTQTGEVDIVASVDNGTAAVQAVTELAPDVAILDLAMPELNGVAVIRKLAERQSQVRTIILSVYESRIYIDQALDAGAGGYVLKRSAFPNIAQAVRAVCAGGTYIDPFLPARSTGPRRLPATFIHDEERASLTEREREILRFVAFGFTSKEVADRLGATAKAVETQKARACCRLGITSRAQIVQFAILQGWLQGDIPVR